MCKQAPTFILTHAYILLRTACRAQAFIKDNVTGFQPRPEDLAYPAKLEAAAAAAAAGAAEIAEGNAPEEEEAEAKVSHATVGISSCDAFCFWMQLPVLLMSTADLLG